MTRLNWKEEKVICEMCQQSIQRQQGKRFLSTQLFLCLSCYQDAVTDDKQLFSRAYQHDSNHQDTFIGVLPILTRKMLNDILDEYRENVLP